MATATNYTEVLFNNVEKETKKVFESIDLDIEEVADFIEEQGLSFICNEKMQVEASEEDFAKLIERFPEIDYIEA